MRNPKLAHINILVFLHLANLSRASHHLKTTGTIHVWDWKTGYNFQRFQTMVQPGSLDSEAGLFAMTFDKR